MPLITVVVPVYKVEQYLLRCVDSILSQSFSDFELILVDDGSPDNCGAICDGYADKDSRVHVIHQKNGGLSAARNTGIDWVMENSISEWITFIDSDDWVHPKYLELLIGAAETTGQEAVVGGFVRTQQKKDTSQQCLDPVTRVIDTERFYCADKVTATVAWGKLYRKEDFAEIRYPEGKIHEDEFTTYKLLFKYPTIAFVNCPLYYYYQNPKSIMGSGWNPKHMAECDGMLEQLDFFKEKGFKKAEKYAARLYLTSIYRNLQNAAVEDRYAAKKTELRRRLKRELKRYSDMSECTLKNTLWLYYEAYPCLTLPYRAFRRLKAKTAKR